MKKKEVMKPALLIVQSAQLRKVVSNKKNREKDAKATLVQLTRPHWVFGCSTWH
uniref:Uncharacterized protein n=1 Tax=Arundo donax TaxID=35708 RepID=A0A0A8XU87_ARUDO